MTSGLGDQSIRTMAAGGHRRPAFTLVELIVSMAVLVVLMAIAGEVMTLTVESTGQAMALTKVNESLRILEQTLRRDLASIVRPGPGIDEASLLLIQGNPVNAYWDQNGKDVDDDNDPADGYPHARDPRREEMPDPKDPNLFLMIRPRADILMFFTRGEGRSVVDYTYDTGASKKGATPTPPLTGWKQVVYGHADLGEYIPPDKTKGGAGPGPLFEFSPGPPAFEDPTDLQPLPISTVPAERWHLARRVLHMAGDFQEVVSHTDPWADLAATPETEAFDWEPILLGQTDIIGNATGDYSYASLVVDTEERTGWPSILNGEPDILDGDIRPFARSKMDLTPPALYAGRLGHYFLPNCASFKVEWTLDPRSDFVGGRLDGERQVYWFDPGDLGEDPDDPDDDRPLRSLQKARDAEEKLDPGCTKSVRCPRLEALLEGDLGGGPGLGDDDGFNYSLEERFGRPDPTWHGHRYDTESTFRPNLVVFTAKRNLARRGDPENIVPEDIYPAALRITVDVYDEERRLEKPIRHVMVIPVGEL